MTENAVTIPASVLVVAIRKLLGLGFPTICRHSVAASLLSILEEHGVPVSDALARAVVQADDESALELLLELERAVKPPAATEPSTVIWHPNGVDFDEL